MVDLSKMIKFVGPAPQAPVNSHKHHAFPHNARRCAPGLLLLTTSLLWSSNATSSRCYPAIMSANQLDINSLLQTPYDWEELYSHEIRWRDRQSFLQSKGYILRPRLRPGWVPSWRSSGKHPIRSEDGIALPVCRSHTSVCSVH